MTRKYHHTAHMQNSDSQTPDNESQTSTPDAPSTPVIKPSKPANMIPVFLLEQTESEDEFTSDNEDNIYTSSSFLNYTGHGVKRRISKDRGESKKDKKNLKIQKAKVFSSYLGKKK